MKQISNKESQAVRQHMPEILAKFRSEGIVQYLGKRGMDVSTELILFKSGDIALSVPITPDRETVWLTQDQMSELFDTARSSIAYHIGRIFSEGELNRDTSVEIFDRSTGNASRPPMYHNVAQDLLNALREKCKEQGVGVHLGVQRAFWTYCFPPHSAQITLIQSMKVPVELPSLLPWPMFQTR